MAESDSTPRPSSPVAAAEETTPLLATECIPQNRVDDTRIAEIPSGSRNGGNRPPYNQDTRSIKIFSYVSAISSVVTGVLLLAFTTLLTFNKYVHYSWYLTDYFPALGFFLFLTLVISLLVLRRISISSGASSTPGQAPQTAVIHPFVNTVFDIVVALYIANIAGTVYDGVFQGGVYCYSGGDDSRDICQRWKLAFKILSGCIIAGAAVVALSHLIIFVIRMIGIFRSRFWARTPQLSMAPGRYSLGFEVTFKVVRPDGEGQSSV